MKKLTREQKRKKKAQKRREYKKRKEKRLKKQKQNPKPWEPVKMKMFQVPNIFPKELSQEKRTKIIKSIGVKSKKDFNIKFSDIEKWFENYDAPYVLSFCALYFVSSPEGIDPETTGSLDFPYHLLEILQAFSLYQPRTFNLQPLQKNAEKLQKEMGEVSNLMMLGLLDFPEDLTTEVELRAYRLRTEMMAQTTAVRNWAYYYQMKKVVIDLSKEVDSDFKSFYGIGALTFVKTIFKLIEERDDLVNSHLDKVRKVYRKKGGLF